MPLGNQQIERLARLARLKLSPSEITRFSSELEQIVRYFQLLQKVDTTEVDFQGAAAGPDELREDSPRDSLRRDLALRATARTDGQFFLVPRVIR